MNRENSIFEQMGGTYVQLGGYLLRVCQVKCVSFFDFIWRSVFDRHIYTINLIKW